MAMRKAGAYTMEVGREMPMKYLSSLVCNANEVCSEWAQRVKSSDALIEKPE